MDERRGCYGTCLPNSNGDIGAPKHRRQMVEVNGSKAEDCSNGN